MKMIKKIIRRLLCKSSTGKNTSVPPENEIIPSGRFESVFPGLYEQAVTLQNMAWRYGHLSHDETLVQLAALVRNLSPRRIFEFGTFDGRSAVNMALNMPENGRLFTLDLPDEAERGGSEKEMPYMKQGLTRALFREKRVPADVLKKIEQLQGDSKSFDFIPFQKSMDLIFVDGGHDRETAASDSVNAFAMLKSGGIILWDDYSYYWPGVREVLDRLAGIVPLFRDERTNLVLFGPARGPVPRVEDIRAGLERPPS